MRFKKYSCLSLSMVTSCHTLLQSYPKKSKVALRIVEMYQQGELDPAVAMQLLGNKAALNAEEKKRSHAALETKGPDSSGDVTMEASGEPGESLDELLSQAKKARMDSLI